MPAGRPTDYREEYNEQVTKLCKLGATDKELADFFEVAESTINLWKEVHPQFSESIKEGKIQADANVAQALYHRAIGYKHEDVDIRVVDKEIIETPLTKYYPPDPTAGIFWLKNRRNKDWRDMKDVDLTSGGDKIIFNGFEVVKPDDPDPKVQA